MNIGIIGSGRIGSTVGTQWARAGHAVMFSSRHPERLEGLLREAGPTARAGSVPQAAAFGEVLLFAIPWAAWDDALQETGDLTGKVIVDATNPFGMGGLIDLGGVSATEFNARRVPGARLVRAYNTLTAGFQREAAGRAGDRVAMPMAGEDAGAKVIAASLIRDSGYDPFDVGGFELARFIEPPRRPGAFYGEEWTTRTATALLNDIRARRMN